MGLLYGGTTSDSQSSRGYGRLLATGQSQPNNTSARVSAQRCSCSSLKESTRDGPLGPTRCRKGKCGPAEVGLIGSFYSCKEVEYEQKLQHHRTPSSTGGRGLGARSRPSIRAFGGRRWPYRVRYRGT